MSSAVHPTECAKAKDAARFMAKVSRSGGCWTWSAGKTGNGYGKFRVGSLRDGSRRIMLAHRWSFLHFRGQLNRNLQLDHLCRNRLCVNPAHLEQVTGEVNNARSDSVSANHKRKTQCKNGHPFTAANTYVIRGKWRACVACRRINRARAGK